VSRLPWSATTTAPPLYALTQFQDITARKRAEAQLTHQALHDVLTGMPNRLLMLDHLTQALARATRTGKHVGVLFLDLDDFKLVNDSLGHDAGDELLQEIAARINGCLRGSDTAARLGGDEFVVVCEDLDQPDDIAIIAGRLDLALRAGHLLRGHTVSVSASVGVATGTLGSTPQSLLQDADTAMYRAKDRGKGRYEIADPQLQARALRQLTLEDELRRAIDTDQFELAYQPCIDLDTGAITAVEALLRWNHPQRGLVLPDEFLDVAEDRDLIAPLGAWVIRTACRQAAFWKHDFGGAAPDLWVNISSRQLGKHHLTHTIEAALAESRLPAQSLTVELTERQLLGTAHSVLADLNALPEIGVHLAIDDFGTGHNGLEYLREINVDTLKIDKSFIAGLGTDRTVTALTASVISLAHNLDLDAVAEGVETPEQRRQLRDLGCHLAQGYLLGRPTTAIEIGMLLSSA
jgi:diguanylate cyclase (GGDEF)-like protein